MTTRMSGGEGLGGTGAANERLGRMLPNHHFQDDILLAYAAGTLGEAASVVVASHLSLCPACRARVLAAEAVGGALLDDMTPEPVAAGSLSAILDKLDASEKPVERKPKPKASSIFPQPLMNYMAGGLESLRWGWVQPGVKFAELMVDETGARMGLLRSQPGASITPHGHSGDELTLVLTGGYRDADAGFRRGDVQVMDESVTHELTTDRDGECISLVVIRGRIKPTRLIAKIFRHFTAF